MRIIFVLVLAFVLLVALRTRLLQLLHLDGAKFPERQPVQTDPETTTVFDPERFSPDSDLEELDLAQLRNARSTIDAAMYAFTDRRLAEVLTHTDTSVQIRLYRDGEQFEIEQRRAIYSDPSIT